MLYHIPIYIYTSVHVIHIYINHSKRYPWLQKTPGAKHLWWSICSIGVQSCLAPDSWKMLVPPLKHFPLKIGHPQKESCLPSINFQVRTGRVRDHYKWPDSFFGGNQTSSKCIVLRHFPLDSDLVGMVDGWWFILAEWGFFLASVHASESTLNYCKYIYPHQKTNMEPKKIWIWKMLFLF